MRQWQQNQEKTLTSRSKFMPPKPKFKYIEPRDVVPGDIIKWDSYSEIYTVTGPGKGDIMLIKYSGGNTYLYFHTSNPGKIQWRGRDEKIYKEWREKEKEKERKELESHKYTPARRQIWLRDK